MFLAFDVEWVSDDMTIGSLDFRTGAIQGDAPGVKFVRKILFRRTVVSVEALCSWPLQFQFVDFRVLIVDRFVGAGEIAVRFGQLTIE